MAKNKKRPSRKLSSAAFTRQLPKLTQGEIERYIRQSGGKLTRRQQGLILRRQSLAQRASSERKTAQEARRRYRPRKGERGKIVFVNPSGSGHATRKGYTVYVTRTGKKWLLRQPTEHPYKAVRLRDVELPLRRNLRRAQYEFQRSRLEQTARGLAVQKGSGRVKPGSHDFSDSVVNRIAASIKKTIEAQASHRAFLIEVNLLLRHPDGTASATSFSVPIDRADHIAIKLAGVLNFVRLKFYAFMARALQYLGFITAGSAAHIKSVTGESEVTEEVWTDYHQEQGHNVPDWAAPRFEVVKLETIEWRILQAK